MGTKYQDTKQTSSQFFDEPGLVQVRKPLEDTGLPSTSKGVSLVCGITTHYPGITGSRNVLAPGKGERQT